jgi:hypothetical protein
LIAKAGDSIPACSSRDMLRQLVLLESERLVPKSMCDGYRKRAGKLKAVKTKRATPQYAGARQTCPVCPAEQDRCNESEPGSGYIADQPEGSAILGTTDFCSGLERLYASPRLYSFSLTNPFTRWVTRRRTQKLFDLMAGFVHTQVMLGCIRLNLFKMLHQAPADLKQIAQRVNMPEPVLQRLLLSAVSLGLLEYRSQSRFGLGPLGVPLATHDGIAAMIEHNHLLYADMQDPLGFLNNAWQGSMAAYWPYAHDAQAATRAAHMTSSADIPI